jgi:hypothetical protein
MESKHDLGFIHPGDVLEHTFEVGNDSKATMELRKIKSDCGCVYAQIGKTTLNPGETTTLGIRVQAKKRPGSVRFSTIAQWKSGDIVRVHKYVIDATVADVIEFPANPAFITFEP